MRQPSKEFKPDGVIVLGVWFAEWFPKGLTLLPIILLTWFTIRYFVELPFWDEFLIPRLMMEIESGKISLLGACWRLHNEHRLFFPTLIMLELAKLTAWHIRAECCLILLLAIGCFCVICRVFIDGLAKRYSALAIMVSSFLMFSENQWENWLWGFQIQILLMEVCFLLALCAVTRRDLQISHMASAAVFSLIGSFSFATGLLSCPLIALALLLRRPRHIYAASAFGAMFIAALALYFYNYKTPESHPSVFVFASKPEDFMTYILIVLGSPISQSRAVMLGGMVLTGFIAGNILMFSKCLATLNMRIALLLMGSFAIGSAILIGLGRAGFGAGQALSSRYVTITNLLWLSDIGYLYLTLQLLGTHHKGAFKTSVTALCLAAMLPGYMRGWHEGQLHHQRLKAVKVAVLNEFPAFKDETLVQILPVPRKARERLLYMAERKLSLFHKMSGSGQ